MGELEIQDLGPEGPYIRGSLSVINGAGLGGLILKATKVAPKFWGVDKGNPLMPIPGNTSSRLIMLRDILRKAPNMDPKTAKWAFDRNVFEMEDVAKKTGNRKITLQKKKKDRPLMSTTYLDAYREPVNKLEILGTLLEVNNPVAETVLALDEWRMDNQHEEMTLGGKTLGFRAFETFFFSVLSDRMLNLVGEVALKNHVIVES